MHPADINAALIKRGLTQRAIAKRLGIAPPSVSNVINNRAISHRVAKAISEAVGIPVDTLWPGRYQPHGYRRAT